MQWRRYTRDLFEPAGARVGGGVPRSREARGGPAEPGLGTHAARPWARLARLFVSALVALGATPLAASAVSGPWTVDAGVGVSETTFTLTITCSGNPDVCNVFGGYVDTQVSTMSGGGTLDVDALAGTLQFGADGLVDVGLGPVPSYFQLFGTNLAFAGIPFFGIPEVQNATIFALDAPLIPVPGVNLTVPGDYPFSTSMAYSGLADVVGDVSLVLPEIVVDPQVVAVSGTLRVLGDIDQDMMTELEVRDIQVTFTNVDQYVDLGAILDITITADLTANLSAEVPAPALVPVLAPASLLALAAALGVGGTLGLRRRRGPLRAP